LQLYGSLRLFVLKHLKLISNTTPTKQLNPTVRRKTDILYIFVTIAYRATVNIAIVVIRGKRSKSLFEQVSKLAKWFFFTQQYYVTQAFYLAY